MKFTITEDKKGEIIFSDEEITIINKHKKFVVDPAYFKHFLNQLVNMANILNIEINKIAPQLNNTESTGDTLKLPDEN